MTTGWKVGDHVWAPFGDIGWRSGTITKLGKKWAHLEMGCADKRVTHVGKGKREIDALHPRDPGVMGSDKPQHKPGHYEPLTA